MDKKKLIALVEDAYLRGVRDGLEAYAWWKDGRQYVGTTKVRLSDAKDLAGSWVLHTMVIPADHFGPQISALAAPTEEE